MMSEIKNFFVNFFKMKNPNIFDHVKFIKNMKKQKKGLMSKKQYLRIAKKLSEVSPCNLLVFGLGDDSYLWSKINSKGKTIFLEDNKDWIETINNGTLDVEHVIYKTTVENQKEIGFIPEKLELSIPNRVSDLTYDFIIVDAPLGHQPPRPFKGPGRMSSIYMAFKLLKKGGVVVIDDMSRPIEKLYAFHYFKEENLIDFIEKKVGIFQNTDKISS
tara:strand:+ start:189 stop:836 length:648 start_codon:yes stop_codon:yes gene_type:complete